MYAFTLHRGRKGWEVTVNKKDLGYTEEKIPQNTAQRGFNTGINASISQFIFLMLFITSMGAISL